MTLFALLELHRRGEATWTQKDTFGPIEVQARVSELTDSATIEALLFLSPDPVSAAELAEAIEVDEEEVADAVEALGEELETGGRGVRLRKVAGGYALAAVPDAEDAARRLLSKPRTPPLTQAQAEVLAIVAYLQPVSRPEIARIRGVSSDSAVASLTERGLIEERGGPSSARSPTRPRPCSRSSSVSPASTPCPTPRSSTRPPRTSESCASGC